MRDAFAYVLFAAVGVGACAAFASLFMTGGAYDEIGKGGFHHDDERPAGGGVDPAERDDEIRQLLGARNARRSAAGRPTMDVESELERLTAPAIDERLRAEIRAHVQTSNARRIRRGREPLDVDAEVERQIRELGGS